jgi:hypothetical protein
MLKRQMDMFIHPSCPFRASNVLRSSNMTSFLLADSKDAESAGLSKAVG